MSKESNLSITFDALYRWKQMVKKGLISSTFIDQNNHLIEVGLRPVNDSPEFYAINRSTGFEIQAQVEESFIQSSFWQAQYNPYRGLKPQSYLPLLGKQPEIPADSIHCRFACQDVGNPISLLSRPPVFRIALANFEYVAFHNGFPFEPACHLLLLPCQSAGMQTILPHYPQKLTEAFVEDFLAFATSSRNSVLFFNSVGGAGGSVSHQHWQLVYRKNKLALEDAGRIAYGKFTLLQNYPANGIAFDGEVTCEQIWHCIQAFQDRNIACNLIALANSVYLFPRDADHEIVSEFPSTVLASFELAGKIITSDRNLYDRAVRGQIDLKSAFGKTTLSLDRIKAVLDEC